MSPGDTHGIFLDLPVASSSVANFCLYWWSFPSLSFSLVVACVPKPSTTSGAVKPPVPSFLLDITSLPRQALQTTTDLKLNSVSDSTNGFAHWGPSKPPPPVSIETPSPHRPHPLVAIETMPTLSFEGPPPSLATWDTTCFMKPSSCAISPRCSAERNLL